MSYFVGIDVAKFEHVVSIYNSSTGEFPINSLHFDNDAKGFNSLLSSLKSLKSDDIFIGFESTAHYHINLFKFLTSLKYKCYLINPYMTSKFRSISLRNAKNDNIDSRAISQFLSLEYNQIISCDFSLNELRDLCNQRDYLIKQSSMLKTKLITLLDKSFPELESIISKSGIYSNAMLSILSKYSSAVDISSTRIDHLISMSNKASGNKFNPNKILLIKEKSKSSIGIHSYAINFVIKQTINSLNEIKRQIDEIESIIISHPEVVACPLHKLKGINNIEIAYIISAINSIARFPSYRELIAFAGLDPVVRQSGTFIASKTRMSKRGSKLFRYALIWTANNMCMHESSFKEYYNLKRSQGKSHYNALGHCATKLCRFIYYILNNPDKDFSY